MLAALSAKRLVVAAILLVGLMPRPSAAAACDDWLRQTRAFTGEYVLSGEPYARAYVFAMLLACKGKIEAVTVQSATGRLPVCGQGQQVELTGTLIWNKWLVDGHYEINDPAGVTCRGVAQATSDVTEQRQASGPNAPAPAPAPAAPVIAAPPTSSAPAPVVPEPRVAAMLPSTAGSGTWTGRYQDSRGAGDVTFTLVRGVSTISGTWKMRTGGGGPITGLVDPGGTRIQIRMESLAADCPGTFEGAGEITTTTLTATYRGKDCEGAVDNGRLELRLRADR